MAAAESPTSTDTEQQREAPPSTVPVGTYSVYILTYFIGRYYLPTRTYLDEVLLGTAEPTHDTQRAASAACSLGSGGDDQ